MDWIWQMDWEAEEWLLRSSHWNAFNSLIGWRNFHGNIGFEWVFCCEKLFLLIHGRDKVYLEYMLMDMVFI